MSHVRVDEVGYWTEVKLEIVKKYAQAYSTVVSSQTVIRKHLYVDAFAGAGVHISKQTGDFIPGSPLNAFNVTPQFSEYHFIDLDGKRANHLRQLTGHAANVFCYNDDCNKVLLDEVFPRAKYNEYCRALCLLDPYALNLNWEVLYTAGQMRSVEVFLNFMVMDMNMNVLWRNPDKVGAPQLARMDAFWGDRSWRNTLYQKPKGLLPGFDFEEKVSNEDVARAFQDRLKKVAGFSFVPDPMPMRNTCGAVVYYLFFASQNATGSKIVSDIFGRYRNKGVV